MEYVDLTEDNGGDAEASCYFCGETLTVSEFTLGDGSCLSCFTEGEEG